MDQTIITGNLPNMTVEISHRSDPEAGAELMTIHLRATPDFQSALPLLGGLSHLSPLFAPMTLWTEMLEAWAAPWQQIVAANPLLRFMGEGNKGK